MFLASLIECNVTAGDFHIVTPMQHSAVVTIRSIASI